MHPLDYLLCVALSFAGLQVRALGDVARAHVSEAHGALVDAVASRGLVRVRAATLAVRALLFAVDQAGASPAPEAARAQALARFRRLLASAPPPDPRAELARAWQAWRAASGVEECLALAWAALHVGAFFVEGAPNGWPVGDLTGRQLARELGRGDLIGEGERAAPAARLEVV